MNFTEFLETNKTDLDQFELYSTQWNTKFGELRESFEILRLEQFKLIGELVFLSDDMLDQFSDNLFNLVIEQAEQNYANYTKYDEYDNLMESYFLNALNYAHKILKLK